LGDGSPGLDSIALGMIIDQLRSLYESQPFRPFILHLADRRAIPVAHKEFLSWSPSGRTIVVHQPDESLNIIDLLLVTDLEIKPDGRRRRRRKGA